MMRFFSRGRILLLSMGFFLSTTVNAQEDELRRELSTLADTLRKEHGEWIRSDKTSPDPIDAAIPRFARIAERSRGTKTGSRSLMELRGLLFGDGGAKGK